MAAKSTKNKTSVVKEVLLTINGGQDPYNNKEQDGPILSLLKTGTDQWRQVVIFHTPDFTVKAEETRAVIEKRFPGIEAVCHELQLDDPTNYEAIFRSLREGFKKIKQEGSRYSIAASSGTPAMHACWLLLAAAGEIPAKMVQLRNPAFAKKGQPLRTEIDPDLHVFPTIHSRPDLPKVDDRKKDASLRKAGIIGNDPEFLRQLELAAKLGTIEEPVLILGESGTGKELFAKFIHHVSARDKEDFTTVNCGAIPETLAENELFGHKKGAFTGAENQQKGYFKQADGGTLFLDEIGDLPLAIQVKLLRAIDYNEIQPIGGKPEKVNVRLIAATNKDLKRAIKDGEFREDLYYRLGVFTVNPPPLRHRKDDIPVLAKHFFDLFNAKIGKDKKLPNHVLASLKNYGWKGNARELRNVMDRMAFFSDHDEITEEDFRRAMENTDSPVLIPEPHEGFSMPDHIEKIRSMLLDRALELTDDNATQAAKLLGVSSQNVNKLRKKKAKGQK